jgi:uncharacterized membrane protein
MRHGVFFVFSWFKLKMLHTFRSDFIVAVFESPESVHFQPLLIHAVSDPGAIF